jgi:hypothetical protein
VLKFGGELQLRRATEEDIKAFPPEIFSTVLQVQQSIFFINSQKRKR